MLSFSWLHFTDLHCGMKDQDWLWPGVREIFFEDLNRLHEKCGPWDLVLFTGDLTQKGSAKEFEKVDMIFEQFWEFFEKLGSSPKLLAVPGNHDLVRPEPNDPPVLLLKEWSDRPNIQESFWDDPESPYRKIVTKAFEQYAAWWEKQPFRVKNVNAGILPGDFSVTIEKDGAKLGIVGLNTSFLQLDDKLNDNKDYKGNLAIHTQQFHGACNGDGTKWAKQHRACLLLTHHPPEWLNPESKQHLYGEITDHGRFAVHLCGHMHKVAYQALAEGGSKTRFIWQGRSLFGLECFGENNQNQGSRKHGYTVGNIKLKESQDSLLFWPREARLQGATKTIVPDFSVNLTDNHHTSPIDLRRHHFLESPEEVLLPPLLREDLPITDNAIRDRAKSLASDYNIAKDDSKRIDIFKEIITIYKNYYYWNLKDQAKYLIEEFNENVDRNTDYKLKCREIVLYELIIEVLQQGLPKPTHFWGLIDESKIENSFKNPIYAPMLLIMKTMEHDNQQALDYAKTLQKHSLIEGCALYQYIMGQCYRKTRGFDDALYHYEEAIKLIDNWEQLEVRKCHCTSKCDVELIEAGLYRGKATVHRRQIKNDLENKEKHRSLARVNFEKAIEIVDNLISNTEGALKNKAKKVGADVYYSFGYFLFDEFFNPKEITPFLELEDEKKGGKKDINKMMTVFKKSYRLNKKFTAPLSINAILSLYKGDLREASKSFNIVQKGDLSGSSIGEIGIEQLLASVCCKIALYQLHQIDKSVKTEEFPENIEVIKNYAFLPKRIPIDMIDNLPKDQKATITSIYEDEHAATHDYVLKEALRLKAVDELLENEPIKADINKVRRLLSNYGKCHIDAGPLRCHTFNLNVIDEIFKRLPVPPAEKPKPIDDPVIRGIIQHLNSEVEKISIEG